MGHVREPPDEHHRMVSCLRSERDVRGLRASCVAAIRTARGDDPAGASVRYTLALYLILWLAAPGSPISVRFALALGLEAGWEIFENTPFLINRYRESALAQGYFGGSVINSVSDTVASVGGFV
ncbi:MAG: DUF2585 family protein, partial [Mesorhizobium sp.]